MNLSHIRNWWDRYPKNLKGPLIGLLVVVVVLPLFLVVVVSPTRWFPFAAPATPPVTLPITLPDLSPTITPTPTLVPGCTNVSFTESKTANGVNVTVSGAWNLSIKANPTWQNVTYDSTNLLITLQFNVPTGTISIYTASYTGAPLCQTYVFGNATPTPTLSPSPTSSPSPKPTNTPTPTPTPSYSLTVTYPNGGESFVDNSTPINVTWKSSNNLDSVELYYISQNGNVDGITQVPDTGSYSWIPHTIYPTQTQYKIGLYGRANYIIVASGLSDNYFTIAQPTPTPTPTLSPTPTPTSTPTPTPTPPSCNTADLNKDGVVNGTDLNILLSDFFKTNPTNPRSDINGDGIVDITDYSLLVAQYNQSSGKCL